MAKPVQSTAVSSGLQTVLLIGSTGNGKSCLGNFLLDPDWQHITENQTFQTGRSNMPETQVVKCETDKQGTIQVIDTPGLNEEAGADLLHMIDIVSMLRDVSSISACILCVKFDTNIDAQYKATVAYYSRLLPMLFEGNVLIVLTDFRDDPHTLEMRRVQKINVEGIVHNTVREIVKSGNLSFTPQVFKINCLPIGDDERRVNEEVRRSIMDYIRHTITPIRVTSMKVAKTDTVKQRDAQEIKGLDGEIHGYKLRLVEVNKRSEAVLSEIERSEKEKNEIDGDIRRLKDELEDKDTSELVVADMWSLSQKWTFGWQSQSFKCSTAFPIVKYTTWDNGHITWVDLAVARNDASGRIEGEFMRGLYANLTLKTHKQYKYAREIESLKDQIRGKERSSDKIKNCIEHYTRMKQECERDIKLFEDFIKQKNEEKQAYYLSYMTVEEAINILNSWRNLGTSIHPLPKLAKLKSSRPQISALLIVGALVLIIAWLLLMYW